MEIDLEKPYQDSHDWSEAANVAFATVANLEQAKKDLMWISGAEKEKTCDAIQMRWSRLKSLVAYIEQPIVAYDKVLYANLKDELADELKDIDEAVLEYLPDNDPTVHFSYYLNQYAEVLVEALKGEMESDSTGGRYEAELFEMNR